MTEKTIALFVTCLVDLLRPEVAEAALVLLRRAGVKVTVPRQQTCCGQPAYNGGDPETARQLAVHHINLLEEYEAIIVPSASCAGMMALHYPRLFDEGTAERQRAERFAAKIIELTDYLSKNNLLVKKNASAEAITHHDSCSALREMQVTRAPRALLDQKGYKVCEPSDPFSCCGFGGAFSVKFSEISHKMACEKLAALEASGAPLVTSCDLGCLLHLQGTAEKLGKNLTFRHIAEILAEENRS